MKAVTSHPASVTSVVPAVHSPDKRAPLRRLTRQLTQPRRGLSREESAIFVGVSATKFDEMVKDGRMPQPKTIDGRVVWDLIKLDLAFGALPDQVGAFDDNPWDAYT
jgi:predicted DNA-binding transcriptional regulator AlpA